MLVQWLAHHSCAVGLPLVCATVLGLPLFCPKVVSLLLFVAKVVGLPLFCPKVVGSPHFYTTRSSICNLYKLFIVGYFQTVLCQHPPKQVDSMLYMYRLLYNQFDIVLIYTLLQSVTMLYIWQHRTCNM